MIDAHTIFLLALTAVASFLLAFLGSAVGLILGHLRLPLLIYLMPSTTAGMATNLAISGVGALAGTVRHVRDGRVSWQLLALMGIPSVVGAALGALFLMRVDTVWARVLIGGFLVTSGLNLLLARSPEGGVVPVLRKLRMAAEVAIGLAIGFLASVTGLMLGSLRLPMMIRLLKVEPAVAVGTNMAIGCLTAFAGMIGLSRGEGLSLLPLLCAGPATILGGYLGARYTGNMRKESLQKLVGVTVALTGLGMAAEGVWRLTQA